ncbi:MAG: hypothetical protein QOD75_2727 [Blastocatellia bacterium]|jgi:hypothetical protein|nr:hypothetical protein [Blastocatellia bacterium]
MSQELTKELAFDKDLEILDRYQLFSAEVLRLALAGMAAIGFLVTYSTKGDGKPSVISLESYNPRLLLCLALIALACSAFFALSHRFVSTESIAEHLVILRKGTGVSLRDIWFRLSTLTIYLSGILLCVGAILLAIAFVSAMQLQK